MVYWVIRGGVEARVEGSNMPWIPVHLSVHLFWIPWGIQPRIQGLQRLGFRHSVLLWALY